MAKNDFPKPTADEAYPLGHASNNKDASDITGFKYPAGGGNDLNVYKQPMGLANGDIAYKKDPNRMKSQEVDIDTPAMRVSVGDPANNRVNRHGEKQIRGCGAATKGTKSRGPMA